jgi:hypothetical protein
MSISIGRVRRVTRGLIRQVRKSPRPGQGQPTGPGQARDYERRPATHEAMVYIASIRRMLKLCKASA